MAFLLRITALDPLTTEARQAEVEIEHDAAGPTPDLATLTAAALEALRDLPTWPTNAPQ